MICSVRLEAYGDEPQQVKDDLDAGLVRLGLGIGEVTDEVYERMEPVGYKGRIKVLYENPMNARVEAAWDEETDRIREMVSERYTRNLVEDSTSGNTGSGGTWSTRVSSG